MKNTLRSISLAVAAAAFSAAFSAAGATYGDFSRATQSLARQFGQSGSAGRGRTVFVSAPENASFLMPDVSRLEGFAAKSLASEAGLVVAETAADADFVWKSVVTGSTDSSVSLSASVDGRSGRIWAGSVPVGAGVRSETAQSPSRASSDDPSAIWAKLAGQPAGKTADVSPYPSPASASPWPTVSRQPHGSTFAGLGGMSPVPVVGGTSVLSSLFSLVWSGDSSRTQERGFLGRYVAEADWRYRKNDDAKSSQNFDFGGRAPLFGNLDISLRGFLDWDDKSERSAVRTAGGKNLTAYGADVLLQYSFRRSKVWNPYAGLGLQWIHADFGPSRMLGGSQAYYEAYRELVREYNRMAAAAGSEERIPEGGDSFCPVAEIGLEINVTRKFSLRGDFQHIAEGLGNKNDFADDPRELVTGRADWLVGEKFSVGFSAGYEFEEKTFSATAGIGWMF